MLGVFIAIFLNLFLLFGNGGLALGAISGHDGNARAHDVDGNFTDDGSKTFSWDGENRLVAVTDKATGNGLASYSYDYQGRRIGKTTDEESLAFVYQGWNPVAEYEDGVLAKTYTWGMDLSGSIQGAGGVGGLLSVNDGTDTYYPTFDGNGNVSEYLDVSGLVVAHYEYDSFGNTVVATGAKAGDFSHRFSTKQWDAETGFYYYGHRYYDPITGSWKSRDPLGEDGGLNLYGFVGNDRVNKWDRLGWDYDAPWKTAENYIPDYKQVNNEIYEKHKWHTTGQRLEFKVCHKRCGSCDYEKLLKVANDAFANFSAWDNKVINNIGVEHHGDNFIAFDRKGFYNGWLLNDFLGKFGGVSSQHWVTLQGGDDKYAQRAYTNSRHIVLGVRVWGAQISDPGYNDCRTIALYTLADETWNNLGGRVGYSQFSREAKDIWSAYLLETAKVVMNSMSRSCIAYSGTLNLERYYHNGLIDEKNQFLK